MEWKVESHFIVVLLITKLRDVPVLQGISYDQCSELSTGETLKCVGGACLNLKKTCEVRKSQKGFGALGLGALRRQMGLPMIHSQVSLFTLVPPSSEKHSSKHSLPNERHDGNG